MMQIKTVEHRFQNEQSTTSIMKGGDLFTWEQKRQACKRLDCYFECIVIQKCITPKNSLLQSEGLGVFSMHIYRDTKCSSWCIPFISQAVIYCLQLQQSNLKKDSAQKLSEIMLPHYRRCTTPESHISYVNCSYALQYKIFLNMSPLFQYLRSICWQQKNQLA